MHRVTLFDDGGHQAVRLPKDVQFEGVAEIEVKREGGSLILTPMHRSRPVPADTRPLGDALAAIWGKVGLTDKESAALEREIARNKQHIAPPRFN